MTSILIIPDCHSDPESTSERFSRLGNLIVDRQPDHIICLGDFADFRSLSSYDKGKFTGEGKRVKEDFTALTRDMEALFAPLDEYNLDRKAQHRTRYRPKTTFLMGNHEDRLEKFVNDHPNFVDFFQLTTLLDGYWDEVIPFLQPYHSDGIVFSHFFPSKMGRALGGVNAARSLMKHNGMSCVAGHSHEMDFAMDTRADGTKLFGLVAGWYGDPRHNEKWSRGTDHKWWSGVVLLHGVENGFFRKMETISYEDIREGVAR